MLGVVSNSITYFVKPSLLWYTGKSPMRFLFVKHIKNILWFIKNVFLQIYEFLVYPTIQSIEFR